jgi:hypothetical protein
LTEVVEDFIKPVSVLNQSETVVVMDAPLALYLLGVSGNRAREETRRVIDALKSIGCSITVHTALMRREVGEDFVRYVGSDPEGALKQIGIPVRNIGMDDYVNQHRFFRPVGTRIFFREYRGSPSTRACMTLNAWPC